ncbi:hypothetical protein PAECIP112173_01521 [Paenibacillus sp. JJ-100]|nr:hypothetical protein PAECIP112173_01521 [Paenibacillus sp. JJ-100]
MAAVMTGIGGGIIRDLLAGRKPFVLRDEIYAVWAMTAGFAIGTGWFTTNIGLLICFVTVVFLRMCSVHYKWKLPRRSLTYNGNVSLKTEKLIPQHVPWVIQKILNKGD